MVDIDERVVQMKFDSSDFEAKTKSTFKVLDSLKEKLSFKDVDNTDTLEQVADNVQKMADKAYTIVDRMLDKIKDNIANKLLSFLRENTIGQIMSGWGKYADMTTSVATLKAQGYALETINEQLERLSFFSDETSYKFTDMVTEIGKFTASGKSLEDSTLAMMGIANWAALSGKNANEASRAMYQLSQALGAGAMRMQDWKSIQNLNMDTIEFRKNAVAAAIEIGTLKDNLNGTYTTLVGEHAKKVTFSMNEFADKLTKGAWFTSDVMMKVFGQYAEAVDEIKAIVDEEGGTAADALRKAKDRNKELFKRFEGSGLSADEINKTLSKWKKVNKVTDDTVKLYAKANNLTEKMARENMNKEYAEYLKEYSQIFKQSEQNAEEAMDDWKTYVSEFGIKAFSSAQEAKTFIEAIESAKDAASTVWTQMFQLIFGNYDEAKELWTDLANGLYEVFVDRLWSIHDILDYWKNGQKKAYEEDLKKVKAAYEKLTKIENPTEATKKRITELKQEITELEYKIQNVAKNGRTIFFQGVYAFFSGIKSIIDNIREAWDGLFGENESGEKLISFSERFRISMFRFYRFMQGLGETDFYKNIAISIKNILTLFSRIKQIVGAVVREFLPEGQTFTDVLVTISEKIRDITEKLIPSKRTATNIARILRGMGSIIRFIGKIALGVIHTVLPILSFIFDVIHNITTAILETAASIADLIFETESSIDTFGALEAVAKGVITALKFIGRIISTVLVKAFKLLSPLINMFRNSLTNLKNSIKKTFSGGAANAIDNVSNSISDLGDRIKKAWNSTENLKDIFKRFSGGSGLGNFFSMISEMCMNVVRRIGYVITAIFDLQDTVGNNKIYKKMENFKQMLNNVFVVIKWIFTNVIFPVLSHVFSGIRSALDDIAIAVEHGDILGILDAIKRIFQAINAVTIYKVLKSINRLLGSGGILRIIRNAARVLKSFWKYWDAQALDTRASALQKFVVVIAALLGIMFILANLKDDTLIRMYDSLKMIGLVMAAVAASILVMSLVAQYARGGLIAFALACVGLTIALAMVLKAVSMLGDMLTSASNGELYKIFSGGGIIMTIASGLGILLAIFAFISSRLSGVGTMGLALLGIGAALYGFAYAMAETAELIQEYSFSTIAQAFMIAAGGIIVLAAAMRMIEGVSVGGPFKSILGGSLGAALMTVATVATFAFVMVPALEALAEHMDRFDEYMKAMALFSSMLLSVALSLNLINRNSGILGLRNFTAIIAFQWFMSYVSGKVLPFIVELGNIEFTKSMEGVKALSLFILAISASILIISIGIERIFNGIAKLKFGNIMALVLGLAAVFATITAMAYIFDSGVVSWKGVAIALGALMVSLIALGAFVAVVSRILRNSMGNSMFIVQVIKSLLGILITIGLTIVGAAITATFLFNGEVTGIIAAFASIAGALTVVMAAMAISFSLLVKSIAKSMRTSLDPTSIIKALRLIFGILIAVGTTIVGMMATIVTLRSLGMDQGVIIAIIALVASTIAVTLGMMGSAFTKILKAIRQLTTTSVGSDLYKAVSMLRIIMGTMIALMAGIFAIITSMGLAYSDGYEWQAALNMAALGAALGVILGMMLKTFTGIIKTVNKYGIIESGKGNKTIAILATFGAVAAGIMLSIGAAFMMLMKYQDNMSAGRFIGNTVILIGTFAAVVLILTASFKSIIKSIKGMRLDGLKFALLETILGVMLVSILEMGYLIEKLKNSDLVDLTGAISIVLVMLSVVGTITLGVVALIKSMKGLTIKGTKAAIIFATLGSILMALAIIGTVVLPALANISSVDFASILSAFGGVSMIILSILAVVVVINKVVKTNIKNTIIGLAAVILGFIVVCMTIATFGNALTQFMNAFAFVDWNDIMKSLVAIGGIMLVLTGLAALNGVLEKATNHFNLIGMAAMLVSFGIIAGILGEFGDEMADFFESFTELEFEDVGKMLLTLGGILAIVTLVGVINGALTEAMKGLNLLGLLIAAGTILGMAKILELSAPMLAKFFDVFEKYNWDDIIHGLMTIGIIGAGAAAIGAMMTGALPGVIAFIGVVLALAGAIYLLANAYKTFREASGAGEALGKSYDESIAKGMSSNTGVIAKADKKVANATYNGFANNKKIKLGSPSKSFIQAGKWIDLGLAKGIQSNIPYVGKAATNLAVATNDDFRSELGIASPSKAFYENGRYVVRGLINGMDSESAALNNQGYNIGSNISDGIADGLEGTDWDGIFGNLGFEDTLTQVLGEGGNGILDQFHSMIYGDESFDETLLSEEDRAYRDFLLRLQEANEAANEARNSMQMVYDPYSHTHKVYKYDSSNTGTQDYLREKTRLQNLINEVEAKGMKGTGIAGLFKNGVISGLTGLIGDSAIGQKVKDFCNNNIIGSIKEWWSGEGKTDVTNGATDVVEDLVGKDGTGGTLSGTLDNAGKKIGNAVTGGIDFSGMFEKAKQLGKSIVEGVAEGIHERLITLPVKAYGGAFEVIWDKLFGDTHEVDFVAGMLQNISEYTYENGSKIFGSKDQANNFIMSMFGYAGPTKYAKAIASDNFNEIMIEIANAIRNNTSLVDDALNKGLYGPFVEVLNDILKRYGIASPSKEFAWIGEMINAGFVEGVHEFMPKSFKEMEKMTDGILDEAEVLTESKIKLPDLLDSNVTPRLTPILDDSNIINGINVANRSFDAMNPQVDATVSAFMKDMPDYSDKLDNLENAVNAMAQLLYGAIEDSGIVRDVNITVEPDSSNIFDLVVKENKMRKQRLGYSGLI